MCDIFRTGRPANFELGTQMDHEDSYHRQAPWPPWSKVKDARSRSPSDSCWRVSWERKVIKTAKLVGRLATSCTIKSTRFKVKRQRSRSPGRLMLIPKMCHIFRIGTPANFNLSMQMDHEDLYQRQALWPPRSKVKVARSCGLSGSS